MTPSDRAAMCDGKEGFASAKLAHEVGNRWRVYLLEAYRCPSCRQWHLGKPPDRIARAEITKRARRHERRAVRQNLKQIARDQ